MKASSCGRVEHCRPDIAAGDVRHCIASHFGCQCCFLTYVVSAIAGSVDVPPDLMEELLQAADQYMLGSLKRLCEIAIADTLTVRGL